MSGSIAEQQLRSLLICKISLTDASSPQQRSGVARIFTHRSSSSNALSDHLLVLTCDRLTVLEASDADAASLEVQTSASSTTSNKSVSSSSSPHHRQDSTTTTTTTTTTSLAHSPSAAPRPSTLSLPLSLIRDVSVQVSALNLVYHQAGPRSGGYAVQQEEERSLFFSPLLSKRMRSGSKQEANEVETIKLFTESEETAADLAGSIRTAMQRLLGALVWLDQGLPLDISANLGVNAVALDYHETTKNTQPQPQQQQIVIASGPRWGACLRLPPASTTHPSLVHFYLSTPLGACHAVAPISELAAAGTAPAYARQLTLRATPQDAAATGGMSPGNLHVSLVVGVIPAKKEENPAAAISESGDPVDAQQTAHGESGELEYSWGGDLAYSGFFLAVVAALAFQLVSIVGFARPIGFPLAVIKPLERLLLTFMYGWVLGSLRNGRKQHVLKTLKKSNEGSSGAAAAEGRGEGTSSAPGGSLESMIDLQPWSFWVLVGVYILVLPHLTLSSLLARLAPKAQTAMLLAAVYGWLLSNRALRAFQVNFPVPPMADFIAAAGARSQHQHSHGENERAGCATCSSSGGGGSKGEKERAEHHRHHHSLPGVAAIRLLHAELVQERDGLSSSVVASTGQPELESLESAASIAKMTPLARQLTRSFATRRHLVRSAPSGLVDVGAVSLRHVITTTATSATVEIIEENEMVVEESEEAGEAAALRALRAISPVATPALLKRYVKACGGDRAMALKRLRATVEWRKSHEVDVGLRSPKYAAIKAAYLHAVVGWTRDKMPVVVEGMGGFRACLTQLRKQDISPPEMIQQFIFMIEWVLGSLVPDPPSCGTFVRIYDLKGVRLMDMADKEAIALGQQMMHILEEFYPERMAKAYVVNTPGFFATIWRMVRPLLDPRTANKIHVLSSPKATLEELRKIMDDDQIPQAYGGKNPAGGYGLGFDEWYKGPEEAELKAIADRLNAAGREVEE